MSILDLFCSVDDFWQQFAPNWHHDLLTSGQRQRLRATQLYPSEIMTMVSCFISPILARSKPSPPSMCSATCAASFPPW
jgi:hypothetical protein